MTTPTINERLTSPHYVTGNEERVEVTYLIEDCETATAAYAVVWAAAPQRFGTLYRQSARIQPLQGSDGTVWEATIDYVAWKQKEDGDVEIKIRVATQTEKITRSLATISRYGKAERGATPPPDFKGAINAKGRGEVEGVEILVPKGMLSISRWIANDKVSSSLYKFLMRRVATVNQNSFLGFDPGELLFEGLDLSPEANRPLWKANFDFSFAANETGIEIPGIEPANKRGWEYLWTFYERTEDENGKTLAVKPLSAYVEQVYRLTNFNDLGIEV